MIDISEEVEGLDGGVDHFAGKSKGTMPQYGHIDKARKLLHRLMAEEEMRDVITIAIVLNCKHGSRIYEKLFESSKETRQGES